MTRYLLAAVVLAVLVVPFGGGCSDAKKGDPKVQNPPKDGGPPPLGAPKIGGGDPKKPGPKPE